jgi:hypothetical protein
MRVPLIWQLILLAILPGVNLSQKTDTVYASDLVKIVGDTSIKENKIESILIKFEPFITFKDFGVKLFRGMKAAINYKSNITAREYRTIITDTYKSTGLNFAGHYCFVYWGLAQLVKAVQLLI